MGEWTAIRSGNVTGFVRSENLMEMKSAQQKIRQMEAEALKNGTEVTFPSGETKEEEASRLQAEAEQRAREEAERKQAQRQAVVDTHANLLATLMSGEGRASQTERTVPDSCSRSMHTLVYPFQEHPQHREVRDTQYPIRRHSREISFAIMAM